MNVRTFTPDDAETCFKLRSNAFIQLFHEELSPQDIACAVLAYLPSDYIRMAEERPFFIVEEGDRVVGFFSLMRPAPETAEFPQLYFDLDRLGKGLGSACIDFMERWLSSNWPEVATLVVRTVIPKYNGEFYEKAGFIPEEDTYCEFLGNRIKALKLSKLLKK